MGEDEHSGHYIYTSTRVIHAAMDLEWEARGGVSPSECAREAAKLGVAGIGELCREFIRPLEFEIYREVTTDSDGLWLGTDKHPESGFWGPESVREHGDSRGVDADLVDEATMRSLDICTSDSDRHYLPVELLIYFNWSIRGDRDAPGRAMLERGLERLRGAGWQVREE